MTGCHSLKNRSLRHAEYIDHNFYSDKIINVVTFRDRLTAGQVTLDHLIVVRIHVPEIIKKRRFSVFFCAKIEDLAGFLEFILGVMPLFRRRKSRSYSKCSIFVFRLTNILAKIPC